MRIRKSLWLLLPAVALSPVVWASGTASAHVPACVESVNPHGQTIPPAGFTTAPGTNPRSGQNDDGFYLISSDVGTPVVVVDLGSGATFGPYPSGTVVKYTQAPGATPSAKDIGSANGQAGAVLVHITGTGDMAVRSIDGAQVSCLVPPPPR
jgi:hypothetical protein